MTGGSTDLIPADRSLPALREVEALPPLEAADIANREHELVVRATAVALDHAIRCGEALLAARAAVKGSGESWERWVAAHLDFSPWWARGYMRIAHHRAYLSEAQHGGSMSKALYYLRGLPSIEGVTQE